MATLSATLCRLIFLVGCAGSTSLVGYACLFGTVDADELRDRFAAASGYSLSFATIAEPQPGRILLSAAQIEDPETGEIALAARTVEIASNRTDVGVILSDATLTSPRLADFRPLCEELLARFAGDDVATVWIELGSVSLPAVPRAAGRDLPAETLRDVSVRLHRAGKDESGRDRSLTIEFRRSDRPEAERAKLDLQRYVESGVVRSVWKLDTGRDGLPCGLLARWAPDLDSLGPDAVFRGKATFDGDATSGFAGDVAGRFDGVDLGSLVTARFPHKLSGEATVAIDHCRWSGGRLESLTATVASGPGVVGRSLIDAFRDSLGCRASESGLAELVPNVLFSELGFGIELDERGRCRLSGLLQPTGAMLVDENGPLLSEGSREPLPTARFVQALAPQSDLQVPASEATRTLVNWLPLASATSDDATGAPRAVTRLNE